MEMEGQQFGWGREEGGWRKGPWTAQEDRLLVEYVRQHGEGRWNSVAKITGLKRSGKSCRLRWVNYLRPDLKRCKITPQEESLILELHALWGNRWSTIARSLPGRTDNEIKNYWRTHFKKGKPSKNIERARARFLKQRREMQQQQSQLLHHLQVQQQEADEEVEEVEEDDEDAGADTDTASAASHADETAPPTAGTAQPPRDSDGDAVDGLTMQGMPDVDMDDDLSFLYHPLPAYFFAGGSSAAASTSETGSSEDTVDGAATWGSLWNLDDVVDHDVDGGVCCWGSACSFPPLQDQGLAFH